METFCLFPDPGKAPGLLSFLCANFMTHWGEPSWGGQRQHPLYSLGAQEPLGGHQGESLTWDLKKPVPSPSTPSI